MRSTPVPSALDSVSPPAAHALGSIGRWRGSGIASPAAPAAIVEVQVGGELAEGEVARVILEALDGTSRQESVTTGNSPARFDGLTPGSHRIEVAADGRRGQRRVRADAGETKKIRIVLEER